MVKRDRKRGRGGGKGSDMMSRTERGEKKWKMSRKKIEERQRIGRLER